MKRIILCFSLAVLAASFQACTESQANPQTSGEKDVSIQVAQTPPMGWNSFDAYDCRINEQEFKATVDFMAENLLSYGWDYAVVDYVWFHPEPGAWDNPKRRKGHPDIRYEADGKPIDKFAIDEYGRLFPATERFPSANDGNGFKALADYVHSKGMKFGIHIMRGIPREAVYEKMPIKGTNITADQIAETWDTCNWNNNMWGIDPTKKGAQEYYNSIFELYAAWGVDFIKADDTMYPPYHRGEIELIHNAIQNAGRPMVLSLSCGEAPLSQAKHLEQYANMWRISADFWDDWEKLEHNFDLLNAWSSYIQPGHWPDADMLPIGRISLEDRPHGPERMSQFTIPEHYTLMSLWSIARSPLMMGGDLLSTPEEIIQFLQNEEVLAVNQHSIDNRQVSKRNGQAVWIATDPESGDRYVGLFNLTNQAKKVNFSLELEYMREEYKVRDLWAKQDLGSFKDNFAQELPPHGAGLYRFSARGL